jgi:hypothetical protein
MNIQRPTIDNPILGYDSTATSGGTRTLDVSSNHTQRFTGALTHTLVMPVTTTLALNQSWEIINDSSGLLTVNSSGSNSIVILLPNMRVILVCILNSGTDAASWSYSILNTIITQNTDSSSSGTVLISPNTSKILTTILTSSHTLIISPIVPLSSVYMSECSVRFTIGASAPTLSFATSGVTFKWMDKSALITPILNKVYRIVFTWVDATNIEVYYSIG